MAKPRLAVFNTQPPHLYFGGVERRIMETAKRLQSSAEITVYCGTKAGFRQPTVVDGARLTPIHSTDRAFPIDNWFFNRSLTKKAREIQADVYEAHAVSGYCFARKLVQLGIQKPFIHTVHGVLADEYEQAKLAGYPTLKAHVANRFMAYLAKLEKQTAHQATTIVTISRYSLKKLESCYGIDAGKVRIVPNGVDLKRFKPAADKAAARRQFGLGDDPCVLFVGSLIARKGLPYLVEAAKQVVKERADTKFLIVGEGPLRLQLDASIKDAGLTRSFRFLGNLNEETLAAVYGCADVFVLPSIQEGQGIVLLEAQACGVPVVAFGVGGVNEAVHGGETALLAEVGDCGELADFLLRLLCDGDLRDKMGAAGRKLVCEHFSWDLCAQGMLDVYRDCGL
ncbi:MAG: glycosyltransferase family 4 protein [Candidatus Bathyarchaeota archaeon]|nr:glycosyltransferase family 4 protein [Candidatus Bathyarchaeota archaeon]